MRVAVVFYGFVSCCWGLLLFFLLHGERSAALFIGASAAAVGLVVAVLCFGAVLGPAFSGRGRPAAGLVKALDMVSVAAIAGLLLAAAALVATGRGSADLLVSGVFALGLYFQRPGQRFR